MKKFRIGAIAVLAAFLLTSCASYYRPRVAAFHPTKQADQQMEDHARCESYAKTKTGYDPASAAASGGVIGGLILGAVGAAAGAALGSTQGHAGTGAAIGAATGGILGGAVTGAQELDTQHRAYTAEYSLCMEAKGYRIRFY